MCIYLTDKKQLINFYLVENLDYLEEGTGKGLLWTNQDLPATSTTACLHYMSICACQGGCFLISRLEAASLILTMGDSIP